MRIVTLGCALIALVRFGTASAQQQQAGLRVLVEQNVYRLDHPDGAATVVIHILRTRPSGVAVVQWCGSNDETILERDSSGQWTPEPWSRPCMTKPPYRGGFDMIDEGTIRTRILRIPEPGRYRVQVRFGDSQQGPFDHWVTSDTFRVEGPPPPASSLDSLLAQYRSPDTEGVNLAYHPRAVQSGRSACDPLPLDPDLAVRFARDIEASSYEGVANFAKGDLGVESVGVRTDSGCVSAYAFHGDRFFGGLLLRDSSGHVVENRPWFYPDARQLRVVGRNRVLFEFTEGMGSGIDVESLVALCSFGTDHWIECLHQPLRDMFAVSGVPEGEAYDTEFNADYEVRGDTVVMHAAFRFEGQMSWEKDLGERRFVLP